MNDGQKLADVTLHRHAFEAVGLVHQILASNREPLERLVRAAKAMYLPKYLDSDKARAQVRIARLVLWFDEQLGAEIAQLPAETSAGRCVGTAEGSPR